MKKLRIIPRLDIKGTKVVKGINLEGIRIVGEPMELAKKYYEQGADEILYMDVVASLYERNNLKHIVEQTTSQGIFIPVTVGGGIRTIEDIKKILRVGADKVVINTAATRNPNLIKEAVKIFGSQCIVGSIEAKYKGCGRWEAYIDNGREGTGLDVLEWAKKLVNLGVGELLITSIDKEGTEKGYEIELIKKIVAEVPVPVIACGGAGNVNHIYKCLEETKCDGVAFASLLHYNKTTITKVKEEINKRDIPLREKNKKVLGEWSKAKKKVSIVDYGAGNLKSVARAFESLGNEARLVNSAKEIGEADLLVLPGDGAFAYGINNLKQKGLVEPIKKYVEEGKPLLGICLGMQLLMSKSQEFGEHEGLNLIKGEVIPFKQEVNGKKYCIPHMGWNNLSKKNDSALTSGIPNNSEFYFIHSFYVVPKDKNCSLAKTEYNGQNFCAIVQKDNIYGVQFHPEKSSQVGIKMLHNFCQL